MQNPLLAFQTSEDEHSACCNLFRKAHPKQYQDQDASLIIEQLQKMARAKRHQIGGLQLQREEADLDALRCKDRSQALSFVRISLDYRNEAKREQAKYEQLIKLINTIESARRNLEMASIMFASSKTLQQVLEQMPVDDVRNVMDELRDLFVQHQEQSKELSKPILNGGGGAAVSSILLEEELDKMIAERQQERMTRMQIENPVIVKNKKEAILN